MIKLAKGRVSSRLTDVGFWKPNDGVQMTDVLFPHVSHGFRNKNIHIVTYHVSCLRRVED